jgi:hypothetical protein
MNAQTPIRRGHFMSTAAGLPYWPLDPRPEEVNIETIAHHLAMKVRWNGSVKRYYSVAEHSYYVSLMTDPEDALEGLMHDGSEAYNGDLIRPLKYDDEFATPFRKVEHLNEEAIAKRFNLRFPYPASVKRADEAVTAAEWDQIVIQGAASAGMHDRSLIYPGIIHGWSWEQAKGMFLQRFHDLAGSRNIPVF